MDLGAAICTPKQPACVLCPLAADCIARARGEQERFPVKAAKAERPTRFGAAFVAVRGDGAVLLRQRPDKGLLGGMSEVPGRTGRAGRPTRRIASAPFAADWQRHARAGRPRLHPFPAGAHRLSRDGRRRCRARRALVVAAGRASRRGAAERHEKGDRSRRCPARRRPDAAERTPHDRNPPHRLRHRQGPDPLGPGDSLSPADPRRDGAGALSSPRSARPAWNAEQDRGRSLGRSRGRADRRPPRRMRR